jgi:hypothetical protein
MVAQLASHHNDDLKRTTAGRPAVVRILTYEVRVKVPSPVLS